MERREQMRRWLARRERLGLTLRELSRETGVPVGTLGHWAWKLRRRDSAARGQHSGFVELVPGSGASYESGPIEIVLERGRRLLVDGDVDEGALQRVVRALERC
jgi:hypothetical protein